MNGHTVFVYAAEAFQGYVHYSVWGVERDQYNQLNILKI